MPKCHAVIMWPTPNGGWTMIECPRVADHEGMHCDDIYWLQFTDADIEWMESQYQLCVA